MRTSLLRLLVLLATLAIVSCSGGGGGGGGGAPAALTTSSATLQWSTPATYIDGNIATIAGYKIYYGTESGNYSSVLNVGKVNSYIVQNLTANTTYFFVVTAYDNNGVESDPTDEQSKTL